MSRGRRRIRRLLRLAAVVAILAAVRTYLFQRNDARRPEAPPFDG